jgi:hypothetical protein
MAMLYSTTRVDDTDPPASSAVFLNTLQMMVPANKVGNRNRPGLADRRREEHMVLLRN